MPYANDQLVDHPTWGIGRISKVDGPRVTVFFKDAVENPKTIAVEKYWAESSSAGPVVEPVL